MWNIFHISFLTELPFSSPCHRDDAVFGPASGSSQHQPGAPSPLPAPERRSQRRPHLQDRRKVRLGPQSATVWLQVVSVWCLLSSPCTESASLVSLWTERKEQEMKVRRSETGRRSRRETKDMSWSRLKEPELQQSKGEALASKKSQYREHLVPIFTESHFLSADSSSKFI